jgi:hypothetical protein
MGRAEDEARARRARERGNEERNEQEREASERAEETRREAKLAEERVADSCSAWSLFTGAGYFATCLTLSAISVGTFAMMLIEPDERAVGTTGLMVAVPSVVLAVLVFLFARWRVNAAWRIEKQWMARLPFRIDGLGGGVGSTSGAHRLVVRVHFREGGYNPPTEKARAMMAHVDPGGTVERRDKTLELRARVAGEPDGDNARVKGRRLLFHDLVDGILLPLAEEAPIERIELDD